MNGIFVGILCCLVLTHHFFIQQGVPKHTLASWPGKAQQTDRWMWFNGLSCAESCTCLQEVWDPAMLPKHIERSSTSPDPSPPWVRVCCLVGVLCWGNLRWLLLAVAIARVLGPNQSCETATRHLTHLPLGSGFAACLGCSAGATCDGCCWLSQLQRCWVPTRLAKKVSVDPL